jgi:hypothetical protein
MHKICKQRCLDCGSNWWGAISTAFTLYPFHLGSPTATHHRISFAVLWPPELTMFGSSQTSFSGISTQGICRSRRQCLRLILITSHGDEDRQQPNNLSPKLQPPDRALDLFSTGRSTRLAISSLIHVTFQVTGTNRGDPSVNLIDIVADLLSPIGKHMVSTA